MTRAELFSFVRSLMETDSTDQPDAVLTPFARDGWRRILTAEQKWDFLRTDWSFNTVANQRAYALTTIDGAGPEIGDIRQVIDSEDGPLNSIIHDVANGIWFGTSDTASQPIYWSLDDGSLHLWPKPSTVRSMTVRGYRVPDDTWLTDVEGDVEIDLPEQFHEALAYFVCARAYVKAEDPDLARVYDEQHGIAVNRHVMDMNRSQPTTPKAIGGRGRYNPSYQQWMLRMARGA